MLELTTNHQDGTAPEITQTLDELAREGARRMTLGAPKAQATQGDGLQTGIDTAVNTN